MSTAPRPEPDQLVNETPSSHAGKAGKPDRGLGRQNGGHSGEAFGIGVVLVAIVAAVFWFGKPIEKKNAAKPTEARQAGVQTPDRTIDYLIALEQILDRVRTDSHQTSFKVRASNYSVAALTIDSLPGEQRVQPVLRSALLHGADVSGCCREFAQLNWKAEALNVRIKQTNAHHSSDQAVFELFIRAANGDPFGKLSESLQIERRFQDEFQILAADEMRLRAKMDDLTTTRQRLKLQLR